MAPPHIPDQGQRQQRSTWVVRGSNESFKKRLDQSPHISFLGATLQRSSDFEWAGRKIKRKSSSTVREPNRVK